MHTPDAGIIRVRWYAIPEPVPGVYDLGDYSSSNFDADTYSYDPDIGEESSSRHPFQDWRDCSPPPWPFPDESDCTDAAGPLWSEYTFTASGFAGGGIPPNTNGAFTLSLQTPLAPCLRRNNNWLDPGYPKYDLNFGPGGLAVLGVWSVNQPKVIYWSQNRPVDPTGPFTLTALFHDVDVASYPPTITFNGRSRRTVFQTTRGVYLGTGDGKYLQT